MDHNPAESQAFAADLASDRRSESRAPTAGALWLVDDAGSNVVGVRCLDMSASGLRLWAPLGYGVRPGQRYLVSSCRPGRSSSPELGFSLTRGATVVRADVVVGEGIDYVDVGVALDEERRPVYSA